MLITKVAKATCFYLCTIFSVMIYASSVSAGGSGERSVDVACDANSIRFGGPTGPNPRNPEGDPGPHPYYGASFVVKGYIYPAGTLDPSCSPSAATPCGVNADGSAEFSDQVIGRWICRGFFIGEDPDDLLGGVGGIFTPTGPFVATTQIYDLDIDEPGAQILVSEGIELIDQGVPFTRAIIGGTGRFKKTRGDVTQTAIGTNASGLFNFTFDFDLRPRRRFHRHF